MNQIIDIKTGRFVGNKKQSVSCQRCGLPFLVPYAWIKKGGGKYCSKKCFDLAQSTGISTRDDGYISIKCPAHHRANKWGFVYAHVLVAEKKIGRPLRPSEKIHHINGNPSDNRPENLFICGDTKEHLEIHRRQNNILKGCNPDEEKICSKCNSVLPKNLFSPSSSRGKRCLSSMCKKCCAEDQRLRRERERNTRH